MTTGTASDTTSGAARDATPDVRELRRFNRFYTNLIGALDYGRHLYTPFTLTEARVLYEVAHHERVDAADLRASLSLDMRLSEQAARQVRGPRADHPRQVRAGPRRSASR